jgi:hypothetical protein
VDAGTIRSLKRSCGGHGGRGCAAFYSHGGLVARLHSTPPEGDHSPYSVFEKITASPLPSSPLNFLVCAEIPRSDSPRHMIRRPY